MAAGRLNFSLVVIFVAYVVELKVNQRLTRHPALPVEEDYMYMLYISIFTLYKEQTSFTLIRLISQSHERHKRLWELGPLVFTRGAAVLGRRAWRFWPTSIYARSR